MNNEMMYKMFLNTLTKMNDSDLENTLKKAKGLLSENDYNNLLSLVSQEKKKLQKDENK